MHAIGVVVVYPGILYYAKKGQELERMLERHFGDYDSGLGGGARDMTFHAETRREAEQMKETAKKVIQELGVRKTTVRIQEWDW